jgi:hypothetical protein
MMMMIDSNIINNDTTKLIVNRTSPTLLINADRVEVTDVHLVQ